MRISKEEQEAIRTACDLGSRFGYGNLISHLQSAWAKSLMAGYGMSEKEARGGAGGGGYPLAMHEDLLERGEWDETGVRYNRALNGR